jgi:hypothetical protein
MVSAGTITLRTDLLVSKKVNFNVAQIAAENITLSSGATASVAGKLAARGNATISEGAALTAARIEVGKNMVLRPGANLTHSANSTVKVNWLSLSVGGDFDLQAGAAINVDGKGYGSASGPGAGINGSYEDGGGGGGGHGGSGGAGNGTGLGGSAGYDSITNPVEPGSGGGYSCNGVGGSGGGLLLATVGGTAYLNGLITANGAEGVTKGGCARSFSGGGGSGGAINIAANAIAGSGALRANGGARDPNSIYSGGGGGGIIALNSAVSNDFAGSRSVLAGRGYIGGGAGIVATKPDAASGHNLVVDGADLFPGAYTVIPANTLAIDDLLVSTALVSASTFTLRGDFLISEKVSLKVAEIAAEDVIVSSNAVANVLGKLIARNNATLSANASLTAGRIEAGNNMVLRPGASLTHAANSTAKTYWLSLNIGGDLDLQAGSAINIDGKGYASALGPGAGLNGTYDEGAGGGAGHGGAGGAGNSLGYGGPAGYDSVTDPVELGSGGGYSCNGVGGSGGGLLLATVGGTAYLNGLITANGTEGVTKGGCIRNLSGGGGSGGSINLKANAILGSGTVRANGGARDPICSLAGGGGGGIVALGALGANGFTGLKSALPGSGYHNGGFGVIASNGNGSALYSLSIGSAGIVTQAGTPIPGAALAFDQVAINNVAVTFDPGSSANINSLFAVGNIDLTASSLVFGFASPVELNSGAVLRMAANAITGGNLTVNGNAKFEQMSAQQFNFNSVLVRSGGKLAHGANGSGRQYTLNLNVAGDFTLEAGASVVLDGLGYAGAANPGGAGSGPGGGSAGGLDAGPGGGHGGVGGDNGAAKGGGTYDSVIFPSDLGSGGGGSSSSGGGAGGGAFILRAGGLARLDGAIWANGAAKGTGGGGAGGTIGISAGDLAGSGVLQANGGAGNGGGGRISLAYGNKAGSLSLSAAGSGRGAVGSILDNGQVMSYDSSASAPTSGLAQSEEKLSASQTLFETVSAQTLNFTNAVSTGVVFGTFSQARVELVSVRTGAFAGKGFFRGAWSLALPSGQTLSGIWQGTAFLAESPRRMLVEGVMEYGIRGVLEGALTESSPGSGIFDRFSGECSAMQVGDQIGATSLYFSGSAPAAQAVEYPGTGLRLLQSALTGQASGYIVGPLETTFTLLTVDSPGNPYHGAGFFLPTFSSSLGQGYGRAYISPANQISGVLGQPLRGLFEGAFVSREPRSLLMTLERLDVGLPVRPILSVVRSCRSFANPGAIESYVITVRNDGYAEASGYSLVAALPEYTDFVAASPGYLLYNVAHWWDGTLFSATPFVRWDLGPIAARSSVSFNYQALFRLPVVGGPQGHAMLDGGAAELMATDWATQIFAGYPMGL